MGRDGDTPQGGLSDNSPPSGLSAGNSLQEERASKQVLELRVRTIRLGNILQEDRANDAATTPHEGNFWFVELPVVHLCRILDKHEPLCVGDDLGGIEGLLKVVEEFFLVTLEFGLRTTEDLGSPHTLVLDRAEATGEDGLTDECNRHSEVEGVDGCPLLSNQHKFHVVFFRGCFHSFPQAPTCTRHS